MRVNYYIFFILGAILGLIILILFKRDFILKKDLTACGCAIAIGGIVMDLVMLMITPSVLICHDYHQYERHDYLFKYVDNNGMEYDLPTGDYVDNQSEQTVVVYPVIYGKNRTLSIRSAVSAPKPDYYPPHEVRRIVHEPKYLFEAPPEVIKSKSSLSTYILVMNYENEMEEL